MVNTDKNSKRQIRIAIGNNPHNRLISVWVPKEDVQGQEQRLRSAAERVNALLTDYAKLFEGQKDIDERFIMANALLRLGVHTLELEDILQQIPAINEQLESDL